MPMPIEIGGSPSRSSSALYAAGVGAAGAVKMTRYRFQLLGRERGSGGGELSPLL